MRVFFTNLGCKLNQAELEALARRMRRDGHEIATSLEAADLHVVNSCNVTHVAARTSRKVARQAGRLQSAPRTVLTGCYVSGSLEEAAGLAGVDLVVPNADKERLLERLYVEFPEWRPASQTGVPVPYVPIEFGNSRALVKIEDGCNMRCSFCVIPLTRGSQDSRPADAVVHEVKSLVTGGYREVVVTGVQISSYRWGALRLVGLVRRLLEETTIERLRLTSIAPWDFHPELVDLLQSGRVCRHVHLSLQSGCDRTLETMRRPYTTAQFAELIETLRQAIPGLAITTDVIVGFPGETARDFDASLKFVQSMRFARVHAFPYSPRAGTAAAGMPDRVADTIRRERMVRMLEVAERARLAFQDEQLGSVVPVLWERRSDSHWTGTSDNYLKVTMMSDEPIGQTITPTCLTTLEDGLLRGRTAVAALETATRPMGGPRSTRAVAAC